MAEAQAALRSVAFDLVRLEERCREILDSLPRSPDKAAIFEGWSPWDLPTELPTPVECVPEAEIRSKPAPPSEGASHLLLSTSRNPPTPFRPGWITGAATPLTTLQEPARLRRPQRAGRATAI